MTGHGGGPSLPELRAASRLSRGLYQAQNSLAQAQKLMPLNSIRRVGRNKEAAKQATEILSESNPVRSSDIFLSIQAISQTTPKDLFQAGPTAEKATPEAAGGVVEPTDEGEEEILFAIYLHDPFTESHLAQSHETIPRKWIDWLDASTPATEDQEEDTRTRIPEAIQDIIESGGVDPREWVPEWLEESLNCRRESLRSDMLRVVWVLVRAGLRRGS